jgi:SNF2 family DNA or RNA helicase
VWTYPRTIETCVLLRNAFGSHLRVQRDVSDWFRAARAGRDGMGALAGASSADLLRVPEVAPRLAAAMASRTYQPVGARFIAEGRSVLIADDPGLGKTLEAIGGIIESNVRGPYLVVSPKTAVDSVWAREIPRWWPEAEVVHCPEGRAERDRILDIVARRDREFGRSEWPANVEKLWTVVHPEMILTRRWWTCETCGETTQWTRKPTPILECGDVRGKSKVEQEHTFPQLFGIEWGAIIIDESHDVLVMNSGTPTQRRLGADCLALRPDGLRVAMSGTPWRSKPHQLWGTLNWLDPTTYSGKWRWIQSYWETGGYTGWEIKAQFKPGMEPVLWDSLKGIVLRRTKLEVAKDLPPKIYTGSLLDPSGVESPVGVWLDMTPKQSKAYAEMAKESVARLDGGDLTAVGTLAELTRLRQFATSAGRISMGDFHPALPSNKFDWTVDFLTNKGYPKAPEGKVVIVSQFTRTLYLFLEELRKKLKMPLDQFCRITGEVSGAKREETRLAFNEPVGSDSPHIMFLQIKAGGVAITLDSADDMIVLDEKDPDSMTQVEDRLHRVSNPRQVRYHYLRSIGTVDVGTAVVNAERDAQGKRLLDERRGVSYARAVLEASVA